MLHPRFAAVGARFQSLFDQDLELGARFCVIRKGEVVVDLCGGFADRGRSRPFDDRTLTPVFSVTKLLAAVMVARLVEAGRIAYETPAAEVWPEFAAAGKAEISLELILSHQGGLSGFLEPMEPSDWFDWDLICARLAAMAPIWPPGSRSGYHPVTFGYLAGELFRRVDGRTLGRALREDLAGPLDLDLHIGLPETEDARVAELERPRRLPKFGERTPALTAAFLTPWAAPGGRGGTAWRRAEIPSANGHATALGLARLLDRLIDPRGEILSAEGLETLTRERIQGQDLVLPFTLSWGAGVLRNSGLRIYGPGERAFGHSGWGGACACADPEEGLAIAYVMNRQSAELLGDPRPLALIEAVYGCL